MSNFYETLPEKLSLQFQAGKRYIFAAWSLQEFRAVVDVSGLVQLDNSGQGYVGLIPQPLAGKQEVGKRNYSFIQAPATTKDITVTATSMPFKGNNPFKCRPSITSSQTAGPFFARTWSFYREGTSTQPTKDSLGGAFGYISFMLVEVNAVPKLSPAGIDDFFDGFFGRNAKFSSSTPTSPHPSKLASDDRLIINLDWSKKDLEDSVDEHVIIAATETLPEPDNITDQVSVKTFLPYRKVWVEQETLLGIPDYVSKKVPKKQETTPVIPTEPYPGQDSDLGPDGISEEVEETPSNKPVTPPDNSHYETRKVGPGISIAEADDCERVWYNTAGAAAFFKNPANGEGIFVVALNLVNGSQCFQQEFWPEDKDFALAQAKMGVVTARTVGRDGKVPNGAKGILWDVKLENSSLSVTSVEPWYN